MEYKNNGGNPNVQYIHGMTIVVNVLIPDLNGSHGGAPLDLTHVLNHLAVAFVFYTQITSAPCITDGIK